MSKVTRVKTQKFYERQLEIKLLKNSSLNLMMKSYEYRNYSNLEKVFELSFN